MTQAHKRGPVEILGVTTRQCTTRGRVCLGCLNRIDYGRSYERVARLDGAIESYHPGCFESEFGRRELYEPRDKADISEAISEAKRAFGEKEEEERRYEAAERRKNRPRGEGEDREDIRRALGEGGMGRRG